MTLAPSHVSKGDEPVEAVLQGRRPCGNRGIYGVELLIRGARVRVDGDGQIRVVPPITGVVIAQDLERLGIRFRQIAARSTTPGGPPFAAKAEIGSKSVALTNNATKPLVRTLMETPLMVRRSRPAVPPGCLSETWAWHCGSGSTRSRVLRSIVRRLDGWE